MSLTITNPKVISFYNTHPTISFEFTSLLMVDLLEKMGQEQLSNTMVNKVFERLQNIEGQIKDVSTIVTKNQDDLLMKINLKLIDMQKEHTENIKMIVSSNSSEKIAPLLKDSADNLILKTNLLLTEFGNKTSETINSKIIDSIRDLQRMIQEDTNKLTSNPENIKEVLLSLQQNFISTTTKLEMNMNKNMDEIKKNNDEHFSLIKADTITNQECVNDLIKKMDGASTKGRISENILSSILSTLYPYASINAVGNVKESGDFIMERSDKPKILVENKNWSCNVYQDEVKKFIRDIEVNNCSGVFLSQNTGIANKRNYEINIHNGNVLVYVHFVNNDPEKIKIAIEIIDHFKERLNDLSSSDVDTISRDTLNEINREFNNYVSQRSTMIKTLRDFNQSMNKQIESISMPCLTDFLSSRYGEYLSTERCEFCSKAFKNFAAVKAHQRSCDKKIEVEIKVSEGKIDYTKFSLSQLKAECSNKNIKNITNKTKDELISILTKLENDPSTP
jgi:hypothetical protein